MQSCCVVMVPAMFAHTVLVWVLYCVSGVLVGLSSFLQACSTAHLSVLVWDRTQVYGLTLVPAVTRHSRSGLLELRSIMGHTIRTSLGCMRECSSVLFVINRETPSGQADVQTRLVIFDARWHQTVNKNTNRARSMNASKQMRLGQGHLFQNCGGSHSSSVC